MAQDPDGQRILLVEDSDVAATLLQYLLMADGWSVSTCRDGREAQRFIENEPPVAAALLDILLPYSSGFHLVQMIRGHATWKDVPIMMLTGNAKRNHMVRAIELGANDCMLKPFQPDEVLTRLKRLVQPAG